MNRTSSKSTARRNALSPRRRSHAGPASADTGSATAATAATAAPGATGAAALLRDAAEALPDDAWLSLDRQLCFALYASSLAMTKLYRPLLEPLGLTYPQYLVMLVLWEQDGPAVSELGRRLGLDSGTLTPLLKRLEQAGLIHRQRSSSDERRVEVRLSDAGRQLKLRARPIPRQLACASACSLQELGELTARLHALRAQLGDTPH